APRVPLQQSPALESVPAPAPLPPSSCFHAQSLIPPGFFRTAESAASIPVGGNDVSPPTGRETSRSCTPKSARLQPGQMQKFPWEFVRIIVQRAFADSMSISNEFPETKISRRCTACGNRMAARSIYVTSDRRPHALLLTHEMQTDSHRSSVTAT